MLAFLKLIRLPNLLIIAFTQYMIRLCLIEPSLGIYSMYLQTSDLEFFLLVLATVLVAAGGYVINDYFDVKIDHINKPEQLVIDNGVSGQLVASVKPVKNTSLYEGRIKGATGDWLPSVFTGDSQHIEFNGLTPGLVYTAQVRALGGSTGQSDWSDPSTHMCM